MDGQALGRELGSQSQRALHRAFVVTEVVVVEVLHDAISGQAYYSWAIWSLCSSVNSPCFSPRVLPQQLHQAMPAIKRPSVQGVEEPQPMAHTSWASHCVRRAWTQPPPVRRTSAYGTACTWLHEPIAGQARPTPRHVSRKAPERDQRPACRCPSQVQGTRRSMCLNCVNSQRQAYPPSGVEAGAE